VKILEIARGRTRSDSLQNFLRKKSRNLSQGMVVVVVVVVVVFVVVVVVVVTAFINWPL